MVKALHASVAKDAVLGTRRTVDFASAAPPARDLRAVHEVLDAGRLRGVQDVPRVTPGDGPRLRAGCTDEADQGSDKQRDRRRGDDWSDYADMLFSIQFFLGLLMCLYLCFAMFCVLNIITAVFVENSSKISMRDEASFLMEAVEQRQRFLEEAQALFKACGADKKGLLTFSAFAAAAHDLRVQAGFQRLGLNLEADSLSGLFSLLDFNAEGHVDLEEFTAGVQMLQGQARSLDVARLRHDVYRLMKQVFALTETVAEALPEKALQA